MKSLTLGTLCACLSLLFITLVYNTIFADSFETIWYFAVSFLVFLSVFSWFCLRAYERGSQAAVTNAWLILISSGLTYVAADLLAGHLLMGPLSPAVILDRVTHHRHKPETRYAIETIEYRTVVNIDDLGLRASGLPKENDSERYRIMMLGDSFTLGKGVENGETFSALLEHKLNTHGRRVEVLNGGVNSYSPILSYLALRKELAKLDPDLVVLNLDMSDLLQEAAYRNIAIYDDHGDILAVPGLASVAQNSPEESQPTWSGSEIKKWLEGHLYLGRLAIFAVDRLTATAQGASVRNTVELANYDLLAHTLKTNAEDHTKQWKLLFDSIVRIRDLCENNGLRFFMTIYPWGHQVNNKEWMPGRLAFLPKDAVASDRSLRIIEEFSSKYGIALLNLFSAFRARQLEGPFYYDHDMHWRPIGHEIMAEELEKYIRNVIFASQ